MNYCNFIINNDSVKYLFTLNLADEFVRIVGVGTGAGILANRGLLASFMGGARVVNAQNSGGLNEEDKRAWEESLKRIEGKK